MNHCLRQRWLHVNLVVMSDDDWPWTEEEKRRLASAQDWLKRYPVKPTNATDDALWMHSWRIVNSHPKHWPPAWTIRDP